MEYLQRKLVFISAPRHLHIQTLESMEILSSKTGFKIYDVVFDSGENQFWGSEQYKNNICLYDKNSYLTNIKILCLLKKLYQSIKKISYKIQQGDSIYFTYKNYKRIIWIDPIYVKNFYILK